MKIEKTVSRYLQKCGFLPQKAYFPDLARAVTAVKRSVANLPGIYKRIAKETHQTLGTVTFHFYRAYTYSQQYLGETAPSPMQMIVRLAEEYEDEKCDKNQNDK